MKILFFVFCTSQIFADLIHPPNGSIINYIHVRFEWDKVEGITKYHFELSNSNNFSSNYLLVTDSYYIEKNDIEWQNTYYWRVRSVNNGSFGEWVSSSFSVDANSESFLNDDKPIEILINNDNLVSDGVVIFGSYYNNYTAVIDLNGREIWNSGGPNTHVFFNLDEYNNFLGGKFIPEYNNSLIGCEFSIDNNLIWSEPFNSDQSQNEPFIQHEVIKLPNGNYMGFVPVIEEHLIPTYIDFIDRDTPFSWEDDCALYIDNNSSYRWKGEQIVEWDKNTGEVIWVWDVFDYYSKDDFDYLTGEWEKACNSDNAYDWIHFNALAYSDKENAVYVSSRHLHRITKIDYNTKNIIYNLGIPWLSNDPIIMPDTLFSGQHGLQILNNGNIVTLDNGILSQYTNPNITSPITRAIELEISEIEGEMSANTVWSHTLPYDLYGALSGNVQKLNNDNYLINTIGNSSGAYSIEVTQNKEVVWKCKYNLGNYQTGPLYRAMKIPSLYSDDQSTLNFSNFSIPKNINLKSVYPNPFNPNLNIEYKISELMEVIFIIYDVKGIRVDEINLGYQHPGYYKHIWNGNNLSSGVYFLGISSKPKQVMKKMVLLK